jgi:CheY-like chemotaxis protein
MRIRELLKDSTIFASHGSGIKCRFDIADDLHPVEADESQISQVMSNLVINACQAMPTDGVLEIEARNTAVEEHGLLPLTSGRYVQILVKDHGMGIPAEYLPKIFDPYFSTKSKGNGLGLAVVFSIIKRHGGLVQASSKLGQGSVFTIYLPTAEEDVSPQKAELFPKLAGKGRVLVMDDEEIVREIAREMLTYIGYEVGLAEDGVEAIQLYSEARAKGKPFDAVIMDLTIPGGMGGKQAMEKLMELDPQIKAVVSSGYSNDPTMANHELYGFKGIVAKPYNLDELNQVLQRVLG